MAIDFNLFPTNSDGIKNFGWAGPKVAKETWEKVKDNFNPFKITKDTVKKKIRAKKSTSKKRLFYKFVRAFLNRDIENIPQEIGDCVSWGGRNVTEYLTCIMGALNKNYVYRPVFAPYYYGVSRVFIGQKHGIDFGWDDGSIGSLLAEGVTEYGTLFSDEKDVPRYSGSIAKKWGYRPGPPKDFIAPAKKHLVKTTARITSWGELTEALDNGYPCTLASMLSFTMQPNSKGFHEQTNEGWAHQMAIVGYDEEYKDPYVLIRNSWGDSHGKLYDFETNEALPIGYLRVRKSVIERALRDDDVECFSFSNFDAFYERKNEIDKALFDLFGV